MEERNPTREEFAEELASSVSKLDVEGAEVVADSAIEILAGEGDIEVRDSYLYASDSFLMSSEPGAEFWVSDSTTETEQSRIQGESAELRGKGGAEIRQEDGNIVFRT